MKVGDIVKATVTRVEQYGISLIHDGQEILVVFHELSWNRLSHPSEIAQVGDSFEVKIIAINQENNIVAGSLKEVCPELNAWKNTKLEEGQILEGKVVENTDYGSFIRIARGIEGLLHVDDGGGHLNLGEIIQVQISKLEIENNRIQLVLSKY